MMSNKPPRGHVVNVDIITSTVHPEAKWIKIHYSGGTTETVEISTFTAVGSMVKRYHTKPLSDPALKDPSKSVKLPAPEQTPDTSGIEMVGEVQIAGPSPTSYFAQTPNFRRPLTRKNKTYKPIAEKNEEKVPDPDAF
jgi:hypothetical protein